MFLLHNDKWSGQTTLNASSYLAQQGEDPGVGGFFGGDGDREARGGLYIHSF